MSIYEVKPWATDSLSLRGDVKDDITSEYECPFPICGKTVFPNMQIRKTEDGFDCSCPIHGMVRAVRKKISYE